jgi:hypothetical protein
MNDDLGLPGEMPQASTVGSSLASLRDENRLVRLDLDDLREENRRLRAATGQMRAEIVLLSRALAPMHRLQEELEAFRPSANGKGPPVTAEALRAEVDELTRRLEATYASTSWRLTRPVRLLSRLLRR